MPGQLLRGKAFDSCMGQNTGQGCGKPEAIGQHIFGAGFVEVAAEILVAVKHLAKDRFSRRSVDVAFFHGGARGKPAAGAVTAAFLVRSGWTGVDDVFSGPDNFFEALAPRENGVIKADPAVLVEKLGERYEITRTNIKKWTVGSPIQAPLDALEGFFKKRSFAADDVRKVVVRIASDEADTVSNRDMPDICMEHMVAVMLLDKTVTFSSVHDKARMKDPTVLRHRAKVQVVADPRIDARRPRREAIVEVMLADGTQLNEWVKDVRGTAENPMNRPGKGVAIGSIKCC